MRSSGRFIHANFPLVLHHKCDKHSPGIELPKTASAPEGRYVAMHEFLPLSNVYLLLPHNVTTIPRNLYNKRFQIQEPNHKLQICKLLSNKLNDEVHIFALRIRLLLANFSECGLRSQMNIT